MAAPLRGWSEAVRGPDGHYWSVEVSVPHFNTAAHDGRVEHLVAVTRGRAIRRSVWSRRVSSEADADALLAQAVAALAAGWLPDRQPFPG